MASSKRIGFFWGEEKLTLIEFGKNAPLQVVSAPLESKTNIASPFSSNFTEEIQITAIFQKMLQDNHITGASFYVSLPVKEIILRSFVIPFVKQEDVYNAIRFEAKKYLPIDVQELTFVFYTHPFTENKVKRLQVIFFAVRNEVMARYERVFKQVNAVVSYFEPCMVSLVKVLLFKKEISPTEQVAFLTLDKNIGRICFIDRGIPQFIREFHIGSHSEGVEDSAEALNLRIVNEVGNSFDFYGRQFSGERIEQILIATKEGTQDLFNALETELKLKIRRSSTLASMAMAGQINDTDEIYAMGSCVEAPIDALSKLNFVEKKAPKSPAKGGLSDILMSYKDIILIFLICVIVLTGVNFLFQIQLKVAQQQYNQLFSKQQASFSMPIESIQSQIKDNTDQLAAYKAIRTKSDIVLIVLNVASHLPQGALLKQFNVSYDQANPNDAHVSIDMTGDVLGDDPNEQIAVVNQIFSDFKNDKELAQFIKKVNLVSINRDNIDNKPVTGFNIHCS